MKMMSPPTGVQTKPDCNARLLDALLDFLFRAELRHAQEFANDFRCNDHLLRLAFGDAPRLFARDRCDLAFQVADARFAREAVNELAQSFVGEFDLLRYFHPVFRRLLRNQVSVCNVELLFTRIARQFDNLHTVAQRLRDGIHPVRRGDEQNLRQVERNVEVVIAERVVLFRVEHFHQRRRRVAAEIAAELVDFVEHHDRIVGFAALQP